MFKIIEPNHITHPNLFVMNLRLREAPTDTRDAVRITNRGPGTVAIEIHHGRARSCAQMQPDTAHRVAREILTEAGTDIMAALDLAAAVIELNTGNGAQTQPAWIRNAAGDVDYTATAAHLRAILARFECKAEQMPRTIARDGTILDAEDVQALGEEMADKYARRTGGV